MHSWDTRHLRFLSSYCFSVLLDSVCWFLFTYYNCVCMLWHIYGSPKTSSAGLVLSLHLYTGPRDQTQVIKPAFWIYLFFPSLFIVDADPVFFPGNVFSGNASSWEWVRRVPSPDFVSGGLMLLFRKVCEGQASLLVCRFQQGSHL